MKKTFISCILVAAVVLTSVCVLANDSAKEKKPISKSDFITQEQQNILKEKIKADLKEMLSDGTITQEQCEHLMQIVENGDKGPGRGKGYKRMEMSDEQKAEIVADIKEKVASEFKNGKITQEEYDEKIKEIENGNLKIFGNGMGKRRNMDKSVDSSATSDGSQKNTSGSNMRGRGFFNPPFPEK